MPELQVAEVPREIAARPEYGLACSREPAPGQPIMLSPDGQQILSLYGFAPVGLPTPGR
jgi:hypothetical protein